MLFEQLSPRYKKLFNPLSKDFERMEKLLTADKTPLIPEFGLILKTFSLSKKPKVLILGQDPYPNPDHASGLAFSVNRKIAIDKIPASLKNIFKELVSDTGQPYPKTGDLTPWLREGVLLMNTRLTLSKDNKINRAWDELTSKILSILAQEEDMVVLCWGSLASKKAKQSGFKVIISSAHPSPLSVYRGFLGSRPFSKVNHELKSKELSTIDWRL